MQLLKHDENSRKNVYVLSFLYDEILFCINDNYRASIDYDIHCRSAGYLVIAEWKLLYVLEFYNWIHNFRSSEAVLSICLMVA